MENSITIEMLDPPGVRGYQDVSSTSSRASHAGVNLRAAQACSACRKQKRKCDKSLPACSLCSRMSRPCDYSDSTPTPNSDDFAQLRKKVADLEAKLDAKNNGFSSQSSFGSRGSDLSPSNSSNSEQVSTFPSLFFLDSEMYRETRMTIPRPTITIPRDVAAILGSIVDVRDIVESMKLIMQIPHGGPQDAQNPLYALVKRQIIAVESGALISLQLMQAMILVASYEIGHAVYPAAYLTTGGCVRTGYLLGLHDRRANPQILKRSGAWAEMEEMRRAWWATKLLDSYVSLGIEGRPNATEDPPPSTVLPADDALWDLGEMTTSEPLYVSTPTTVRAGPFARTCQATHLLGKLTRLLNDRDPGLPMRFTQAAQLYRTLEALANLLPGELQQSPLQCSTPIALCYGAIIHLCDPLCCSESNRGDHTVEETEMQQIALAGMKKAAADTMQLAPILRSIMSRNLSAVSPLTADALYMAATTYAWLVHESGSPDLAKSYHTVRDLLTQMNQRWAVAGEYLKALDVTRNVLYRDDPNL